MVVLHALSNELTNDLREGERALQGGVCQSSNCVSVQCRPPEESGCDAEHLS